MALATIGGVAMLAASIAWAGPSFAVVGGHDAQYIYQGMAALEISFPQGTALCGAFIIGGEWAQTNAHCVTNEPPVFSAVAPEALKLRVGTNNRTTGHVVLVDQLFVHAGWQWGIGAPALPVDDIAVMHLTTRVKGAFETARHPSARVPATVIGYGLMDTVPTATSRPATQLQELNGARILPAAQCADMFISEGELCVSNVDGSKGICFGDSGGPVLQHKQVIGSNSRGAMGGICGTGPEVATDATYFRSWVAFVEHFHQVPPGELSSLSAAGASSAAPKAGWFRTQL